MPLPLPRRAFARAGLILCVLMPLVSVTIARAQDGAPDANEGDNAPVAAAGVKSVGKRVAPTPEERRQATEDRLRSLMKNLGIGGAATQDAILDYLAADESARAALREAEKSLMTALRRDVPPERMRDLLGDYRAAIETDKSERASAQRKLDARVGYSLDPKLEAVLWLMGVLGEGASKLPTANLVTAKPAPPDATPPEAPVYGPPFNPNGARGEIVGTVTAKGVTETGEHWLEIRDDSGATDRYAAPWREDLKALDPDTEKQIAQTALSARVRVQWVWQERRRALKLQSESAVTPPTVALPE